VSEPNARQLVSRARKHLAADRREPASPVECTRLCGAFIAASSSGDLQALENVFGESVALAA
jgi:RNA polymerase sigma-70 factor (ECF subfamily)